MEDVGVFDTEMEREFVGVCVGDTVTLRVCDGDGVVECEGV